MMNNMPERMKMEHKRKEDSYRVANRYVKKGQIVFTDSSLMEYFPVNELVQDFDLPYCIYNRGIAGYISAETRAHIQELILDLEPSKLFINIGTNDIARNQPDLWDNYETILTEVREKLPQCRIYVMAFYPCNPEYDFGVPAERHQDMFAYRNPAGIAAANRKLEEMAVRLGCKYIDVNEGLADARGLMKPEFGIEGVHMYPNAYEIVLKNMIPYLDE